jgi:hypothetical protein
MPTDAEIELAVAAIRSIRVSGAKVHDEVVRAYARAAVEAAERARLTDFQRRSRLANEPKPAADNPAPEVPQAAAFPVAPVNDPPQ